MKLTESDLYLNDRAATVMEIGGKEKEHRDETRHRPGSTSSAPFQMRSSSFPSSSVKSRQLIANSFRQV